MENASIGNPKCFSKGCFVGSKKNENSFGNISTSETTYTKDFCSEWHYHENLRFSHILNGGNTEQRKGWQRQHILGTLLFYHPETIHRNVNYLDSTRVFNIEIAAAFFDHHQVKYPRQEHLSIYHEHRCKIIMLKILRECYISDTYSSLSINQLCLELTQMDQENKDKGFPHWVKQISELLNDNCNDSFTLLDFSDQLQVHPVTISKNFSKYFNCTLGEYMRRAKINRALPLLRNSTHSLTEIAYECGFYDQSHFTKTFCNLTGLLPKQYRRI